MTSLRRAAIGAAAAVIAGGAILTGCGSAPPAATETGGARAVVLSDVARVQWDVTARKPTSARVALARLERDVHHLEAAGQLSQSRAKTILAAALGVKAHLYLLAAHPGTSTSTTSTSTTTVPTTTAVPPTTTHPPPPTTPPPGNSGGGGDGGGGHGHKHKQGDG